MSDYPNSPHINKGAIISIDLLMPIPTVVLFQYNPDTLTRSLQVQNTGAGGEGNKSEPFRLSGAPVETITLDIELDATDQLENPDKNPFTSPLGIYPQLAALETLIYPKSSLVIAGALKATLGSLEIYPPESSFTLFVWGLKRVVPIRITDFKVTEEAYDPSLNPIRAKVSLGLRVLSYDDLDSSHPGYAIYLAYQVAKEVMASLGTTNSQAPLAGNFSLSGSMSLSGSLSL
jgi:contractile injection system tube protein